MLVSGHTAAAKEFDQTRKIRRAAAPAALRKSEVRLAMYFENIYTVAVNLADFRVIPCPEKFDFNRESGDRN